MFLENKYKRWYDALITRAKNRELTEGYLEKHHILPKSLGGSNRRSNIVKLTYREHYLVHWLLTKMVVGDNRRSMLWAFSLMSTGSKYIKRMRSPPSWMYAKAKEARRLACIGRPITEECKKKLSLALRGKSRPQEVGQKISNAKKGIKPSATALLEHTKGQNRRRVKERILAFGSSDGRKCAYCKTWDHKNNLVHLDAARIYLHLECKRKRSRDRYERRKLRQQCGSPSS